MLDETGRTKPVLIESNDSKLVERLQINEFLYSAQQARNPLPMLIEKIKQWEKRKAAQVKLQNACKTWLYKTIYRKKLKGVRTIQHVKRSKQIYFEYKKRHIQWLEKRKHASAAKKEHGSAEAQAQRTAPTSAEAVKLAPVPSTVPELPSAYLLRDSDLSQLKSALLSKGGANSTALSSKKRQNKVGAHGMVSAASL